MHSTIFYRDVKGLKDKTWKLRIIKNLDYQCKIMISFVHFCGFAGQNAVPSNYITTADFTVMGAVTENVLPYQCSTCFIKVPEIGRAHV